MLLDRIVQIFLPKQDNFFQQLDAVGRCTARGAECFARFADASPDQFETLAAELRAIEHEGDQLAHALYDELDKSFVTPIDREDLHDLTAAIDDVLDQMEECGGLIVIYHLGRLTPAMQAMIEGAPKLMDHLGEASRANFDAVLAGLKAANIPYTINPRLVRGLDYYNLTVSNANNITLPSGTIGVAQDFTPGTATYTTTGNTIDFNGTVPQTIPAFNYNNLTISGAHTTNNITLVNGGTIGVAGTFSATATFTTGVYVIAGNTFDYNSSGSQSITAFNYNNLSRSEERRVGKECRSRWSPYH